MKIKINKSVNFDTTKPPLIIAEISGNHNGSKKKFLDLIKKAHKSGADLIKIQTYEPEDITLKEIKSYLKIKEFGKEVNFGIYTQKPVHHLVGMKMRLN